MALLSAWFWACEAGRVPMGATDEAPPGAMEPRCERGGEPPGDEALVRVAKAGTPAAE